MPVQLTNLMARTPGSDDLEDITALILACDIAEYGMQDCTLEDLLSDWQTSSFNMEKDAWIVITTKGKFVGFACVWHREHEQIYMFMCVHPEYRGRGIGTLLLRLAEVRAREHVVEARPGARVTLTNTVSDLNTVARELLEREGYSVARRLWRMQIEMDEMFSRSSKNGKLKVEFVIDPKGIVSAKDFSNQAEMYNARQFTLYEKVLRAGTKAQKYEDTLTELVVG